MSEERYRIYEVNGDEHPGEQLLAARGKSGKLLELWRRQVSAADEHAAVNGEYTLESGDVIRLQSAPSVEAHASRLEPDQTNTVYDLDAGGDLSVDIYRGKVLQPPPTVDVATYEHFSRILYDARNAARRASNG
jgi:hypothetical protein